MNWVELMHTWVEIVGTVVTTAAVLVGGWWFFVRRAGVRKANITHRLTFSKVNDEFYVNVQVKIKNSGNRQIIIDGAERKRGMDWANVVLIEEVSPFLESNDPQIWPGTTEFQLLPIDAQAFPGRLCIEPDEEQAMVFDFLVPKASRIIRVYSRVNNAYNEGSGWNTVTIHKVEEQL